MPAGILPNREDALQLACRTELWHPPPVSAVAVEIFSSRGRPLSCALNKQLVSDASELITSAGGPARDLPHFGMPDGITGGPNSLVNPR